MNSARGESLAPPTGKLVAVVGAGAAGMACAIRLALLGNDVALHEARSRERMREAAPLDAFEQERFERLQEMGRIRCEYGSKLGVDLELADLHLWHDAVFLGVGLASSRVLGLSGAAPSGLFDAERRVAALVDLDELPALPVPQRAIVIGAGNTAIDMAVQIQRLGAEEVTLVYRRGFDAMSATVHEQDIAKANQVRMRTWAQPQQVLLDAAGRVQGMRFERTRLENNRLVGTGETFEIAADAVFKAIGQTMDDAALADPLATLLQRDGDRIHVDDRFRTALPGIYAGGDCVAPGQDLTVQAVQHGKLAAMAIHAELQSKLEAA